MYAVQEQEFELSIGDVLQIGDRFVTVIDIDGSEVTFRVDPADSTELSFPNAGGTSPPRK